MELLKEGGGILEAQQHQLHALADFYERSGAGNDREPSGRSALAPVQPLGFPSIQNRPAQVNDIARKADIPESFQAALVEQGIALAH